MSKKTVENIKMIIIVVLFLATILLLYLIWGGSKEVKVKDLLPAISKENTDVEVWGIIKPEKAYYSAGDGSFRSVKDSFYTYYSVMEKFKELSDKSTVLPSEISKDQFEEAVKKHPAIIIQFNYAVPFASLCEELGISGSNAYANVGSVDTVCFSSVATDSLLVFSKSEGKYYRLVSDSLSLEFEEPYSYERDYNCYEVSQVLGAGGDGLFPLLTQSYLYGGTYKEEGIMDTDERTEIARTIFGDSYDFVRRISDGFGNNTFMYGFGQKTLTLGADGTIEYKTEIESGNSQGLLKDLATAKNFYLSVLEKYLSIEETEEDGSFVSLKLKDIKQSGSGRSAAYTFCFVMEWDYEISSAEEYAMEITVENGQVSWLKSRVIPFEFEYDENLPREAMDAANVIAANSASSDDFLKIAENYKSMEQVYYMKNGEIIPVWRLTLNDGSRYFYNIYTGEAVN